jgi:hypothetical protein
MHKSRKVSVGASETSADIQADINNLLFDSMEGSRASLHAGIPKRNSFIGGDKKKLLTIVIRRDKEGKFNFLKSETEWRGVGTWKKYRHEKDAIIEVEFKDRGDFKTKKLLPKLEQYNKVAVGEEKLYARVTPVTASTL